MNDHPAYDARILGRLLLLQSVLSASADDHHLAGQVCSTLCKIPGIRASAFYSEDQVLAFQTSDPKVPFDWPPNRQDLVSSVESEVPGLTILAFTTQKKRYGHLALATDGDARVSHYLPFIENTANLIALCLENRVQEQSLRLLNTTLEEQVQARTRALLESEKLFRSTFENAAIGMCLTHIDGFFKMVNPVFCGMLGYSEEELLSMSFLDITHPGDMDLSREKIKHLLDGDAPKVQLEKRYVHKSGRVVRAMVGLHLVRDDRGTPLYFVVHIDDITLRKQAEEEREEIARRLAIHVAQTPLGVIEWDLDFNVVQWNQAAEHIFGYSRDEALGCSGIDLIVPEEAKRHVLPIWNDLLHNRGGSQSTNANVSKDGRALICDWYNTTLVDNSGAVIGVASLVQDITEARKLEERLQQSQKMEAIGTMAGGIAHDFNNILGIVLGNAELAIDDIPAWSTAHTYIQEIKKASLRAKEIVQQLLSFTRKSLQEKNVLKIQDMVEETLGLLRATIPTSIELVTELAEDAGAVRANPTQIHQILVNLCTNAGHAMQGKGLLTIRVSEEVIDTPVTMVDSELAIGRYIRLTVSDTGVGIPGDILDKVFDPYFTTKDVGKGTGMGLAVVMGIVKGHDGSIAIHSEPGQGTRIDIFFPGTDDAACEKSPGIARVAGGTETLLLVDDEAALANLGKQMLGKLGYRVVACMDPIQGLALVEARPDHFDLVITDMNMPGMSGDQLAMNILSLKPDMPIILCTGYNERINEDIAKGIGVTGYIEKPLQKKQLADLVRTILDDRAKKKTADPSLS